MFIESTENSKKKNPTDSICCLFTYFGMNKVILRVYVFLSMHVVNFMFWVCMLWIWNSQWLGIIILRSPEKEAPWKFWLDPGFPQNPKLKWILKWLPLDRGYFKFHFYKKEKYSNNLMPYVPLEKRWCGNFGSILGFPVTPSKNEA